MGERMLETVNARLSQRGLLFKADTLVGATIIAAPSSTKNKSGERDPEMHSTKIVDGARAAFARKGVITPQTDKNAGFG